MDGELLTPRQVAEWLQLHPVTLSRWRQDTNGPQWIIVGDQVRYRRSDVDAWLAANKRGNGT